MSHVTPAQELERTRYCNIQKLQPAHDYEIKVRALVASPPVPGQNGGKALALGTWSRSIRVRTPNAPPTAPQVFFWGCIT